MNRKAICLSVLFLLVLCGCNKVSNESSQVQNEARYSNLYTRKSQEQAREAMTEVGLKDDVIQRFFANVNHYNYLISGHSLIKEDAIPLTSKVKDYDVGVIRQKWEKTHPNFLGWNCRMTSFDLIKDFIHIGNKEKGSDEMILFDKASFDSLSNPFFTEEQRKDFEVFYSTIPTVESKDNKVHEAKIAEFFQNRQIQFNMPTNLSLISVFFHEQWEEGKDFLFIGHNGILIERPGELLFLEKLSFEEPYQAIYFANKKQLYTYLMKKYDLSYNQPTAKVLIYENDHMMEE